MKAVCVLFSALFVSSVLAQTQSFRITSPYPPNGVLSFSTAGPLQFELRADPGGASAGFSEANSTRNSFSPAGSSAMAHRYFLHPATRTFFGYDVLVEPGQQPDTCRVSFLELGLGPLDVAFGSQVGGSPADWKKLPPPVFPAPQEMHVGDTADITVWNDAQSGQKFVDHVTIKQLLGAAQSNSQWLQSVNVLSTNVMNSMYNAARNGRTVPTVSGTARAFSAEDAEMRVMQPAIKINGSPAEVASRTPATANGTLIWFYLPKRGRYILSLAPRPELGFVKAGEVRGGAITFTLDKDEFTLESYTQIAPGDAPYILYVLHDPAWEPTAQGQSAYFKMGSVSPAELASLR